MHPWLFAHPTPLQQVHLQADPSAPSLPSVCGLGRGGAGRRWPPPATQPRAAQEVRCHRTPYGEAARGRAREGKSIRSRSYRAGGSAPASRAPPQRPAHAGWCGGSRVTWITSPKATRPMAAPLPRGLAGRSRAPGQGLSPFRPTPVTQHPTKQRARNPRPRSCAPGTGSQPQSASAAGGAERSGAGRGQQWAGAAADLSLLLLPGRVQEQVSIPVLFGLHVVVGLLGIIMVHDGARVLGAGFLPPPSLPAAAAAAAAATAPAWGGSRAGLCCASGAGLAPLRPVPPRRCSRRLLRLLAAAAGARGLPASGRALGPDLHAH